MSLTTHKTAAIGAVLVMIMTAFAGITIAADDADAATTITLKAGESKSFSLSQLGLSTSDVDEMNSMDSYTVSHPFYVYLPDSITTYTPYSCGDFEVTGLSYSGATVACPDNVRAGTYSLEWGYLDEAGVDNIVLATTTVVVTNDHDGSSSSKPLTFIDWYVSAPQNYGSYTHTLYIKSGSSVDLTFDIGSSATMTATSGCGLSVTKDGNQCTLSGNITSNCTMSLTYGNYSWTYNLKVVQSSVTHTITYDGNGNTGGSTASTVVTDTNSGSSDVTFADNGFTKTGYTFVGWDTVPSDGTTYQPGDTISVAAGATITAVANWSKNTLTASVNNISGVSKCSYTNQINASANNDGDLSFTVKSCSGGTASVNSSGLVTYKAPTVTSTTSYTVVVTVTGSFPEGGNLTKDVSFSVSVDPVLSFTNAATSGTLSVKGA